MSRSSLFVLGGLVLAAGAALWALTSRGGAASPVLRDAPPLPESPTEEERAAFFFELWASGEVVDLGTARPSAWQLVGERQLVALDVSAVDYLLAPERTARYASNPNLLHNVLRMAPDHPALLQDPRLYPFLLQWLEPSRVAGGPEWQEELRRLIFNVFTHWTRPEAAPAAREELRKERGPLRPEAIVILLRLGHVEEVAAVYDDLPPNEDEPDVDMRAFVLERVREMAATPEGLWRVGAEKLRPFLERLLSAERVEERVAAAAALHSLGEPLAEERILREYERAPNESGGWLALRTLASLTMHPRAREVFVRTVRAGEDTPWFGVAIEALFAWAHEDDVRELLWQHVEYPGMRPRLLSFAIRFERARVVDHVRAMLRSGDRTLRQEAARIVASLGLRETVPQIVEGLRGAPEADLVLFGRTLAQLRAPEAGPLLLSYLRDGSSDSLRRAAAGSLLDLDAADGVRAVADRVRGGDLEVLDEIVLRAIAGAQASLPAPVADAVLHVLRTHPSEGVREKALAALRLAGEPGGVRAGLVEAYRREPSERLAERIGRVLVEHAHR